MVETQQGDREKRTAETKFAGKKKPKTVKHQNPQNERGDLVVLGL